MLLQRANGFSAMPLLSGEMRPGRYLQLFEGLVSGGAREFF